MHAALPAERALLKLVYDQNCSLDCSFGQTYDICFWASFRPKRFPWICRADQEAGGRIQLVIVGLEVVDGGG